ncbi:MAG: VOC family protein, partial [Fimbriimonas sp.]
MVERIHHVQISIPSGAEDQARLFYCGILGLKEFEKPDSLAGRGGFWLRIGDQELHIGTEDDVERQKTKAHVAYQVEDLRQARSRILEAGCQVLESVPIPGYARFEFRDPFGNRIECI